MVSSKNDVPARYSRQILFDGIGPDGQKKLIGSRGALVGCVALGTVQASLLVRAGVGILTTPEEMQQAAAAFDEIAAA